MKTHVYRLVGVTVNTISVLSVVVIVATLGNRYIIQSFAKPLGNSRDASNEASAPQVGAQVSGLTVDFAKNGSTVLLALQVACAWNDAAVGFYRELLNTKDRKFNVLAALPSPVPESRSFLESIGLVVSDVRQMSLSNLQLRSAPALIVFDDVGRVKRVWVGPLSRADRIEARQILDIHDPSAEATGASQETTAAVSIVAVEDVTDLLRSTIAPIVDIRSRSEYARGHLAGSESMPVDELRSRAIHELPVHGPTVIYCGPCRSCVDGADEQRLLSICSSGARQLSELGFSGIHVVKDDLRDLANRGVSVVIASTESLR